MMHLASDRVTRLASLKAEHSDFVGMCKGTIGGQL